MKSGPKPQEDFDIKTKRITREQIDNLADAADRRLAKRGQSHRSIDVIANNTNGEENLPSASPEMGIPPWIFLEALDLYGRVIRNSEFTDATEKEAGARLYLQNCVKVILIICEVIDEILEEHKEELKSDVTPDDIVAIRYLIDKAIFLGVHQKIVNELGTEKMFSISENILRDPTITTAERIVLSMLLLDLKHARWSEYWVPLIEDNAKRRFVLDLLTDKIWQLIYSRPLSDAERDRLADITVHIERLFGRPKADKSSIIADVRRSTAETIRREG